MNDIPEVPAVRARALVKRFGPVEALRGLDLTIERGCAFALLGPNGAGKSTTLSILTGIYTPDEGQVEILGIDALERPLAAKSRIGIVPEELALFEGLSGAQYLAFCGRMHGLDREAARDRAAELLGTVELDERGRSLVRSYSRGMRRRLAIAASLVHAPDILFLDEPFEGIDVVAAGLIRDLLAGLSERGVTLLLTTHVLEIAERLSTHAGILLDGRLVETGPLEALRTRHGVDTLEEVFVRQTGFGAQPPAPLSFYPSGPTKVDSDPEPPPHDPMGRG